MKKIILAGILGMLIAMNVDAHTQETEWITDKQLMKKRNKCIPKLKNIKNIKEKEKCNTVCARYIVYYYKYYKEMRNCRSNKICEDNINMIPILTEYNSVIKKCEDIKQDYDTKKTYDYHNHRH